MSRYILSFDEKMSLSLCNLVEYETLQNIAVTITSGDKK